MELKPCPFCGGKADITTRDVEPQNDAWYSGSIQTFIICRECGCCLFDLCFHDGFCNEVEAADAWNQRVLLEPDAKPFDVEALERVLNDVSSDLNVALGSEYANDDDGFGDLIAGSYNKVNAVLDKIAELKGES